MKTYELFVKTDCRFCKKAVDLISLKRLPFVVTVCDKNPEYLEEIKQLYGWPTVPLILENEDGKSKVIGGCDELEDLLLHG